MCDSNTIIIFEGRITKEEAKTSFCAADCDLCKSKNLLEKGKVCADAAGG